MISKEYNPRGVIAWAVILGAANPDRWRDDEAIAGEDRLPRDEQEMLDELQARVRSAETLPRLINALYDEDLAD